MKGYNRLEQIMDFLKSHNLVTVDQLVAATNASPATIRRDLERMAQEGQLVRVRGGAKLPGQPGGGGAVPMLSGVPFHANICHHRSEKAAIGKAAAALCAPGEAVMIDGGSTTLQMCPHIEGLHLQVLTNSLHIVDALLPQQETRVLVPAGSVFREQNIILSAAG